MKFTGTRNLPMLYKLLEKSLEVTPLYLNYTRHKTHKTLLISLIRYPYCPTIFSKSLFGRDNIEQFQYIICPANPS